MEKEGPAAELRVDLQGQGLYQGDHQNGRRSRAEALHLFRRSALQRALLGFCDVCQTLEIPRVEFGKEVWDVDINVGQAAMLCKGRILVVNVEREREQRRRTKPPGMAEEREAGKGSRGPLPEREAVEARKEVTDRS